MADSTVSLEARLSAELEDRLKITEQAGYEKGVRRGHWVRVGLTVLFLLAVMAGVGILIYRNPLARSAFNANVWYVLLSATLGASVGASELVSRYRDEPMRALRSAPAITYIALNALVSACIYGLVTRYASTLIPALAKDPLMRSITAGFGAMAILRSKFFTLHTAQGEDVGIGPDAAVSAFLSAADSGVDRKRAQRRLELVFQSASRILIVEGIKDSIKVSLLSLQNLADRKGLNKKIDDIYNDTSSYPSPQLKLQATCYEILVALGEYNFRRLIENLAVDFKREQDREEAAKKSTEELVKLLQSMPAEPATATPAATPSAATPSPDPQPPTRPKPRPVPAPTPTADATPSARTTRPSSKPSPGSPMPNASARDAPEPSSTPNAPTADTSLGSSPRTADAADGNGKLLRGRGRKGNRQ
jgi:hypothetical protein